MNTRIATLILSLVLLAITPVLHAASPQVQVEGLFSQAAVLKIDGERKMLRVGQSHRGVTLVAAEAEVATIRVEGKDHVVGLSRHIGSAYQEPLEKVVTVHRDARQQYLTNALINGRRVLVLVDTGANVIALSSANADAMGISFRTGKRSMVETASGVSPAYAINLTSVDVGGIEVHNVEALVVKGDYPRTVLLGMSYLRHVKMQEEGGVLSLSRTQ